MVSAINRMIMGNFVKNEIIAFVKTSIYLNDNKLIINNIKYN